MSKTDFLPGMVNSYRPGSSSTLPAREQAMIARRERLLGPAYRLFYEEPVHFVRGEGVWLYDPEGNAYLDVCNNAASVGTASRTSLPPSRNKWRRSIPIRDICTTPSSTMRRNSSRRFRRRSGT
jgi:hypothetical protein